MLTPRPHLLAAILNYLALFGGPGRVALRRSKARWSPVAPVPAS